MRKTAALLGAGAILAASAALAVPAQAQSDQAQVSVAHLIPASVLEGLGIAGGVVDVWVNGSVAVPDLEPGQIEGPLSLPAGSYSVAVTAANATDDSNPALSRPLELSAGTNYTAAAHLAADGSPALSPFVNDTAAAGAGEGKVTVRHAAANAEGVEVVANGSTSLGTFNNGQTLGPVALPAGSITADVKSGDTVVASSPVPVKEGVNTIVYAWGDPSASPSTFAFAVQEVTLGHSAPSGVPGGQSGSAAMTIPGWIFLAAGVGAAGAVLSGRRLATVRK